MKSPQFVFRADASISIGTGHVMRCLALADKLGEHGGRSIFVCREHPGHLLDYIRDRGHEVFALPYIPQTNKTMGEHQYANWLFTDWITDAEQTRQLLLEHKTDWLIVDHYGLDWQWEQALCSHARRVMVIDDLANRMHNCDLLLDQNLGRKCEDYSSLLKVKSMSLIGPQYALLRAEFPALRSQSLARREYNPQLRRLLITMGGVDTNNATVQVMAALKACTLPTDLCVTVVMGLHAPGLAQVEVQAMHMPCQTEVLVGVDNMAQLMADSDLAIGAAGGTAWERCSLGLPSIVIVLAQNQLAGAVALQNSGAAIVLGSHQRITSVFNEMQAENFANEMLSKLSRAAASLTDGQGTARVANHIMKSIYA